MSADHEGSNRHVVQKRARFPRWLRAMLAVSGVAVGISAGAVAIAQFGLSSTRHQALSLARDPVADAVGSQYRFMWGAAGTDVHSGRMYDLAVDHDSRAIIGNDVKVQVTITSISPELTRAIAEMGASDSPRTYLALACESEAFVVTPKDPVHLPLRVGAAAEMGLTAKSVGATKLVFLKTEVQLDGTHLLPTEDGRETFTLSTIDVRPRPVFFGLSEELLRALQTAATCLGIPGIMAALVGWLLGRKKASATAKTKAA